MKFELLEFFHSIQGEGSYTGYATAFLRFPGCNLWNNFWCKDWNGITFKCDTDISHRTTTFDTDSIIKEIWEQHVCFTGGEPFLPRNLEVINKLIDPLLQKGKHLHFETNGTLPIPRDILDCAYIACSPKKGYLIDNIHVCDELRLVVQDEISPETIPQEFLTHNNVWLSPKNGTLQLERANVRLAIKGLQHFPNWRLNTQIHKLLKVK